MLNPRLDGVERCVEGCDIIPNVLALTIQRVVPPVEPAGRHRDRVSELKEKCAMTRKTAEVIMITLSLIQVCVFGPELSMEAVR